jgi:hypothetical protein
LIPVGTDRPESDERPSVLSSAVRILSFGTSPLTYLDVWCLDPDLNAEFDDVVADLLESVDGSRLPGAAAVESLSRWRRLFRARLVRGISIRARIGLFAEMTMLRALYDADPSLSIDVWTGPLNNPHDFEPPARCLEIKAVGQRREPITINGIRQLEQHDGRPLELVLVTVVPDPLGVPLAELVDSVRTKSGNAAGFDTRLRRIGWDPDATSPGEDTFVVGQVVRAPVGETFPRVVPGSLVEGALPASISDLSYSVNFGAILDHCTAGGLADIAQDATR